MFGTSHWGVPSTNGVPSLDADEARAVLDAHVDLSANGPQLDLLFAWDPVASAAGYHVLQSSSPSFGTSEVIGATAGSTTLTMEDGANTTPSLTFFQVRAVNSCDQEGPRESPSRTDKLELPSWKLFLREILGTKGL